MNCARRSFEGIRDFFDGPTLQIIHSYDLAVVVRQPGNRRLDEMTDLFATQRSTGSRAVRDQQVKQANRGILAGPSHLQALSRRGVLLTFKASNRISQVVFGDPPQPGLE